MRTWFITGAERRAGAAIVERALKLGDSVVAGVRHPAYVTTALDEHERLLVLPLDVTHEAQARAAVAAALKRFGRVDVLVNHAGYGLRGAIEEASAIEVERAFRTNVFGLLNVTRALLPQLRKQRRGQIVNISSIAGDRTAAGWGIHCATRSAVEAISEALSEEGEPLGIYTTLVEPSCSRTDFLRSTTLVRSAQRIADYDSMVDETLAFKTGADRRRREDANELTDAILSLVEELDPPRRLSLGSDLVRTFGARHDTGVRELESWRSLVLSTDFAS